MARKNDFTIRIDTLIGVKIHELRIAMGLSRQQVAEKIGTTHQQLQKYEKGTNRITCGRMAAIADVFDKPVSFFFDGIHKESEALPTQHQRMCIEVARNFLKIDNPEHQEAVNNMVKVLANS